MISRKNVAKSKRMKQIKILVIVGIFYFVPPIIIMNVYHVGQVALMWLFCAIIIAIGLFVYLDAEWS